MNPIKARGLYEGLRGTVADKIPSPIPHQAVVDLKYLTQSSAWNKFLAIVAGKIEEQEKYLADARRSSEEDSNFKPENLVQQRVQLMLIKERILVYREVMGLPLLVLSEE